MPVKAQTKKSSMETNKVHFLDLSQGRGPGRSAHFRGSAIDGAVRGRIYVLGS
jgi:hypothetical protein